MPRAAPDLRRRGELVVRAARDLAESEGWPAVTMRRLAAALGVSQPVIYSVFEGRQSVLDAVALQGFEDLAAALESADPRPSTTIAAYLAFAAANPRTYEAMFFLPSTLAFAAADTTPDPMRRAFAAIRDHLPAADETRAEVAWSMMHGLATLAAAGRLRPALVEDRIRDASRLLEAPG